MTCLRSTPTSLNFLLMRVENSIMMELATKHQPKADDRESCDWEGRENANMKGVFCTPRERFPPITSHKAQTVSQLLIPPPSGLTDRLTHARCVRSFGSFTPPFVTWDYCECEESGNALLFFFDLTLLPPPASLPLPFFLPLMMMHSAFDADAVNQQRSTPNERDIISKRATYNEGPKLHCWPMMIICRGYKSLSK